MNFNPYSSQGKQLLVPGPLGIYGRGLGKWGLCSCSQVKMRVVLDPTRPNISYENRETETWLRRRLLGEVGAGTGMTHSVVKGHYELLGTSGSQRKPDWALPQQASEGSEFCH